MVTNIPVRYQRKLNVIAGINSDIRKTLHEDFYKAGYDTREFAQSIKGSSRLASAFNVWSYLKRNVKYVKDDDENQLIKFPGRLLADGTGDCKSYSLFVASVLKNLGYPVMFRYASYKIGGQPTHVYVVTFDKNGSEIIVDAVHNKFNAEVPYKNKIDSLLNVKNFKS